VIKLVQVALLVLVAVSGLAVVLVKNPLRQAIVISLYGMLLAVLFLVFQAPDVALSITAVGALALPLMTLLALAKTRGGEE
jgi:energy-converting hydrogenase B subunit D